MNPLYFSKILSQLLLLKSQGTTTDFRLLASHSFSICLKNFVFSQLKLKIKTLQKFSQLRESNADLLKLLVNLFQILSAKDEAQKVLMTSQKKWYPTMLASHQCTKKSKEIKQNLIIMTHHFWCNERQWKLKKLRHLCPLCYVVTYKF